MVKRAVDCERWAPCGVCGVCRLSAEMRAGRASEIARIARARDWRKWTAEEDDVIRRFAGLVCLAEIARHVNALPNRPGRSPQSVSLRAQAIGLYLGRSAAVYATLELSRMFGTRENVIRQWREFGLPVRRWREGRKGALVVGEVELKEFLQAHPWLWSWQSIPPGHPLSAWGRMIQLRNPWISPREIAVALGVRHTQVVCRWLREGLVPAEKRPGGPAGGTWRIRAEHLPLLIERVQELREVGKRTRLSVIRAGHERWCADRALKRAAREVAGVSPTTATVDASYAGAPVVLAPPSSVLDVAESAAA